MQNQSMFSGFPTPSVPIRSFAAKQDIKRLYKNENYEGIKSETIKTPFVKAKAEEIKQNKNQDKNQKSQQSNVSTRDKTTRDKSARDKSTRDKPTRDKMNDYDFIKAKQENSDKDRNYYCKYSLNGLYLSLCSVLIEDCYEQVKFLN